jgi:hypothetical protein
MDGFKSVSPSRIGSSWNSLSILATIKLLRGQYWNLSSVLIFASYLEICGLFGLRSTTYLYVQLTLYFVCGCLRSQIDIDNAFATMQQEAVTIKRIHANSLNPTGTYCGTERDCLFWYQGLITVLRACSDSPESFSPRVHTLNSSEATMTTSQTQGVSRGEMGGVCIIRRVVRMGEVEVKR